MATPVFNVTGPAPIAFGPTGGTMQFLGYSADDVEAHETSFRQPVHSSVAGNQMPADMQVKGKVLTVRFNLTFFDPAQFLVVLQRYRGGTAGAIAANEVGALVFQEGLAFQLMVQAPYQAKSTYANNIQGYRVPVGFFSDDITMRMSTNVQVIPIVFYAWPALNVSTLSGTLWDTNMSGFPAIPNVQE